LVAPLLISNDFELIAQDSDANWLEGTMLLVVYQIVGLVLGFCPA